MLMIIKCLSYT